MLCGINWDMHKIVGISRFLSSHLSKQTLLDKYIGIYVGRWEPPSQCGINRGVCKMVSASKLNWGFRPNIQYIDPI